MNDNIKFLLLFFVGLGLFVGFLFYGTKYIRIDGPEADDQNNQRVNLAAASYEEADQKARDLITNHSKYQEMGGKNLIKLSRDSDLGKLLCSDCDGLNYQFVNDKERIYQVSVDFIQLEPGKVLINSADLINPRDDSYYYDLLENQEIDTTQPQSEP